MGASRYEDKYERWSLCFYLSNHAKQNMSINHNPTGVTCIHKQFNPIGQTSENSI